jgi:myo-inositol-hexaphosphate 3-phosphohydrolase
MGKRARVGMALVVAAATITLLISLVGRGGTSPASGSSSDGHVVVALTSPADGTRVVASGSVVVEAEVSVDTVPQVEAQVEFWDGSVFLGAEEAPPYVFTWQVGPDDNGTHRLRARLVTGAEPIDSAPVTLLVEIDTTPDTSAGTTPGTTPETTPGTTADSTPGTTPGTTPATTPVVSIAPTHAPVTAVVETDPVPHSGDAADDPAIWIDHERPERSTIIGTDKLGGLGVYDLGGAELHFYATGRYNNVDLREDFPFSDLPGALVAASERDADEIVFWQVDPATRGLRPAGSLRSGLGVSGLCMYRSASTGLFSVYVTDSSGSIEQWELRPVGNEVTGIKVRTIRLSSTTEGCVADDEHATLYIAQEDEGIWRYRAEWDDATPPVLISNTRNAGGTHLEADVEGLAIWDDGVGGGYLVASSQGDDTFVVFDRVGSNAYVGSFVITAGEIDGVDHTDGIEITSVPLGSTFPDGVFVAQDNKNGTTANQNFKLVSWSSIAGSVIGTTTGGDVVQSEAPTVTGATTLPAVPAATIASGGPTYYVDATSGSDADDGTGPDRAWRTLAHATGRLTSGDTLLLRRGERWTEPLEIDASGTATEPIVVDAYGTGDDPVVTGSASCVRLTGDHILLSGLEIRDCSFAGVSVVGADVQLVRNRIGSNVVGVHVEETALRTLVIANRIVDNDLMSVNDPGGSNDSGAFGVLIQGRGTEVAYNTISGSDAASYDFGRDGAAVEIYGGSDSVVHHNRAIDNSAFVELGDAGTSGNRIHHNVVTSAVESATFVVTRGSESGFGPVLGTIVEHNSVLLTGPGSQGFVCHAGCTPEVLTLRNNIIEAVRKAGFADGPFVGGHNVFSGGATQFALDPTDLVADPRWRDRGASDLHLTAGSPAIGAGAGLGYPTDYEGKRIPASLPDVGALQLR